MKVLGLDFTSAPTGRKPIAMATGIREANLSELPGHDLLDRITTNPSICHGKPCIRGLRYPVDGILELLSSGMTIEEILADYSDLEREDILAVLAYAARLSQIKRVQAPNPTRL